MKISNAKMAIQCSLKEVKKMLMVGDGAAPQKVAKRLKA
jgi:hypothetical protein